MIVISDTTMWAADVPSMCVGMRGVADAEIALRGPERDLHSGSFGGAVPNPLHVLADLLAGLHDADGRVTVPGFLRQSAAAVGHERELIARLPFDEKAWLADASNSGAAAGEAGYSTLERMWARPTAEINGMWGGHTGPGGKTIVPREAHAKLSFRLVAHQEPAEIISALRALRRGAYPAGPGGDRHGRRPRHAALVLAHRLDRRPGGQTSYGTCVRKGSSLYPGRTTGPEADLAEILEAPLVFVGVILNDDRIHAPNEKAEMALLLKGAETAAYLWDELAAVAGELTGPR